MVAMSTQTWIKKVDIAKILTLFWTRKQCYANRWIKNFTLRDSTVHRSDQLSMAVKLQWPRRLLSTLKGQQGSASLYWSAPGLTSKASGLRSPQGNSSVPTFPKETGILWEDNTFTFEAVLNLKWLAGNRKREQQKSTVLRRPWSHDCSAATLPCLVHLEWLWLFFGNYRSLWNLICLYITKQMKNFKCFLTFKYINYKILWLICKNVKSLLYFISSHWIWIKSAISRRSQRMSSPG